MIAESQSYYQAYGGNIMKKKQDSVKPDNYQATAMRVSRISIAVNVGLSIFKLIAGIFAHSGAMISDAIHSASDVLSTVGVMVGVHLAGKKSDLEHPYGHERMESIVSILLAVFLAAVGIGIGWSGLQDILSGEYNPLPVPGILAAAAAILSIAVKEWMYWFTRAAAKRINSPALMADAWHHRSDSLSSIGAFLGIMGARLGFPILDPLVSVIICLFILKAAYDIFMAAVNQMVDHSCDPKLESQIRESVMATDGVQAVDMLHTRMFGPRIYVDVEIAVDGNLLLKDAHQIAENVHDKLEQSFREIKHCMVHVNPA